MQIERDTARSDLHDKLRRAMNISIFADVGPAARLDHEQGIWLRHVVGIETHG